MSEAIATSMLKPIVLLDHPYPPPVKQITDPLLTSPKNWERHFCWVSYTMDTYGRNNFRNSFYLGLTWVNMKENAAYNLFFSGNAKDASSDDMTLNVLLRCEEFDSLFWEVFHQSQSLEVGSGVDGDNCIGERSPLGCGKILRSSGKYRWVRGNFAGTIPNELEATESSDTKSVTPPFLHIAAEANLGYYFKESSLNEVVVFLAAWLKWDKREGHVFSNLTKDCSKYWYNKLDSLILEEVHIGYLGLRSNLEGSKWS
ncbi:hypothetical protein Tco_1042376 [Tanacetum coccineum]|uniref:Uncharacterized protein n=1 Tax=Tanacetum coccineum TaxID=301880 RepID=A0ABQ5GJ92_9ASTR